MTDGTQEERLKEHSGAVADPTSQTFFDELYARSLDPWSFASDPTEIARYEHIVSLLGGRTFDRVFEPGCSIGELTARLAPHARHVSAFDISPIAVERARRRCRDLPHVGVGHGALPGHLPEFDTDLFVLSEIGYYFASDQLTTIVDRLVERAARDALVVGAHWTGTSPDHVISGDDVHDILDAHPRLRRTHGERRATYVIGTCDVVAGSDGHSARSPT